MYSHRRYQHSCREVGARHQVAVQLLCCLDSPWPFTPHSMPRLRVQPALLKADPAIVLVTFLSAL
jgi:hypothetical protein